MSNLIRCMVSGKTDFDNPENPKTIITGAEVKEKYKNKKFYILLRENQDIREIAKHYFGFDISIEGYYGMRYDMMFSFSRVQQVEIPDDAKILPILDGFYSDRIIFNPNNNWSVNHFKNNE